MPALWNSDNFVEGGVKSISAFDGRLRSVEEDVTGKFGPQVSLEFYDIRNLEADDSFDTEDGEVTYFVKQSNKKNSTNGKMVSQWMEFASATKLGPLPNSLYDLDIHWVRAEYDFGPDNNPGKALIPVKLLDGKAAPAPTTRSASPETPARTPPVAVPGALTEAIMEALGEDGGTKDIVRRALSQKAALRKLTTDAGGIDGVLASLVNSGDLKQDEEYYYRGPEDLPF